MKIDKIGVITIDIKLKDRSRIKDFFHRLHSRLEDIAFAIIQKLPEKMIPRFLMEWLNHYLDKRINELKQQNIKQTWQNIYLENAVNEITNRQQSRIQTNGKAPSEE